MSLSFLDFLGEDMPSCQIFRYVVVVVVVVVVSSE